MSLIKFNTLEQLKIAFMFSTKRDVTSLCDGKKSIRISGRVFHKEGCDPIVVPDIFFFFLPLQSHLPLLPNAVCPERLTNVRP